MRAIDSEPKAVYEQVAQQMGQNGESFGKDYAGLKKVTSLYNNGCFSRKVG
jgi:hypothetical protein